jgi:hypothetical protein
MMVRECTSSCYVLFWIARMHEYLLCTCYVPLQSVNYHDSHAHSHE